MQAAEGRIIDYIIELKSHCRFEEEIAEECQILPREVTCLGVMAPGEKLSAGELAARMGLSASRASRIITGLREKGYLSEGFDDLDRRAVSIMLTAAGEKVLKLIDRKKNECEKRLLGNFSCEQVDIVRKGLATLGLAFQGGVHDED